MATVSAIQQGLTSDFNGTGAEWSSRVEKTNIICRMTNKANSALHIAPVKPCVLEINDTQNDIISTLNVGALQWRTMSGENEGPVGEGKKDWNGIGYGRNVPSLFMCSPLANGAYLVRFRFSDVDYALPTSVQGPLATFFTRNAYFSREWTQNGEATAEPSIEGDATDPTLFSATDYVAFFIPPAFVSRGFLINYIERMNLGENGMESGRYLTPEQIALFRGYFTCDDSLLAGFVEQFSEESLRVLRDRLKATCEFLRPATTPEAPLEPAPVSIPEPEPEPVLKKRKGRKRKGAVDVEVEEKKPRQPEPPPPEEIALAEAPKATPRADLNDVELLNFIDYHIFSPSVIRSKFMVEGLSSYWRVQDYGKLAHLISQRYAEFLTLIYEKRGQTILTDNPDVGGFRFAWPQVMPEAIPSSQLADLFPGAGGPLERLERFFRYHRNVQTPFEYFKTQRDRLSPVIEFDTTGLSDDAILKRAICKASYRRYEHLLLDLRAAEGTYRRFTMDLMPSIGWKSYWDGHLAPHFVPKVKEDPTMTKAVSEIVSQYSMIEDFYGLNNKLALENRFGTLAALTQLVTPEGKRLNSSYNTLQLYTSNAIGSRSQVYSEREFNDDLGTQYPRHSLVVLMSKTRPRMMSLGVDMHYGPLPYYYPTEPLSVNDIQNARIKVTLPDNKIVRPYGIDGGTRDIFRVNLPSIFFDANGDISNEAPSVFEISATSNYARNHDMAHAETVRTGMRFDVFTVDEFERRVPVMMFTDDDVTLDLDVTSDPKLLLTAGGTPIM